MITICIPVYNQRVYPLVNQLDRQIKNSRAQVDICLIDDASEQDIRELNRQECGKLARIIELENNVGRAKIRNLFLKYVESGYLLFLDNDVEIPSTKFIDNYINAISTEKYAVIVGGHQYQKQKPAKKYRLRWKYGNKREQTKAKERNLNPYKSFMTSNFLISRNVFNSVQFNESMTGYGHEDTLFGYELKKHKIKIAHLDNPVQKKYLDTNDEFLRKTNEGLISLTLLLKITKYDTDLISDIKLLNKYDSLTRSGAIMVFSLVFSVFSGLIKSFLSGGWVISLFLFDIYKLGTYHRIVKSRSER
ncbi:MAG TPA: glycosyltransferase [Salinivirga sp.]|uniref:glycosyltransferase family 2 protein n=1 Tax=Salinivirga sp. TaxID=1970192 RepID=UPI002B491569|nr:glycosyltransferase [Salinivirga sp.]HKK58420.1 glycosyltransferase [Salinivirga sp.]